MSAISSSYPKYNDVAKKRDEVKAILVNEYLGYAKENYSKKDYKAALNLVHSVLEYTPNLEEAQKLEPVYQKAYDKEQAEIAKQEKAKEKQTMRQQEAERIKTIKANMEQYEFGTGDVGIGCYTESRHTSNGYTAAKGYIFLYVDVCAYNQGDSTASV